MNTRTEQISICYCSFEKNPKAVQVIEQTDYELEQIGLYAQCRLTLDRTKYGKYRNIGQLLFEEDGLEHDCVLTSRGVLALTGRFLHGLVDVPLDRATVPALWCEGAADTYHYGGRGSMADLPCEWGRRNFRFYEPPVSVKAKKPLWKG